MGGAAARGRVVGLGDGVEKGEVLHQAWALRPKPAEQAGPVLLLGWLPHGSGLTHTLSRTQEVFSTSLLKPVGSLA